MKMTKDQEEIFAKWLVDGMMIWKYNEDLKKARQGHKTLQHHFKNWYGVDWDRAHPKPYDDLPKELLVFVGAEQS